MQQIPLPQSSSIQSIISAQLTSQIADLAAGKEVLIKLGEGGYSGKVLIDLAPDHPTFTTTWRGKDITRFPARIKAAVGALSSAKQAGAYLIAHDNGALKIQLNSGQVEGAASTVRNPNWARDELILALNLYLSVGKKRLDATHPEVRKLSDLLNRLPIHKVTERVTKFRDANGVAMKLGNFIRFNPDSRAKGLKRGNHLEEEVWNEFAHDPARLQRVAAQIAKLTDDPERLEDSLQIDVDEEFPEGKLLTKLHRYRERDSKAARQKKQLVLSQTGKLECEACGFNFQSIYGEMGMGFAECHHRTPISELRQETRTRLSDLAIVCANCHRMLHRSRPVISIEQLATLVVASRLSIPCHVGT